MAEAKAVSRLAALRATQEAETPPPETRADAAIAARIVLDLSTAQENAARGIRRAILLVRRIEDPAAAKSPEHRIAIRKQILRGVEDGIHRQGLRPTDAACLHAELLERLDSPDLDDDIDHLPVAEIIANIIRDIGSASAAFYGPDPHKRRTPEDIALLAARAARLPTTPKPAPPPSAAPADSPPEHPERLFRLLATPIAAAQT